MENPVDKQIALAVIEARTAAALAFDEAVRRGDLRDIGSLQSKVQTLNRQIVEYELERYI